MYVQHWFLFDVLNYENSNILTFSYIMKLLKNYYMIKKTFHLNLFKHYQHFDSLV